jgi:hypothetical protein
VSSYRITRRIGAPLTLPLIVVAIAMGLAACEGGVATPVSTDLPASTTARTAAPVIVAGVDMIKPVDERELVALADAVIVGRPMDRPSTRDIGDDHLVEYLVDVQVGQLFRGSDVADRIRIQWLGVSPDIENYVADPDLEPLDKLMSAQSDYLLFLFEGNEPGTYNIVGHLSGLYPIRDGVVGVRDGGFDAFNAIRVEELADYLDELADA